ncbi:hypothetical protein PL8927_780083 [Planktothrix serta PCC 8927]|uniref:Uncharacterized protein n=1 Tax=Planktothrix serta PCC 8927 TaxID=671068 RepID=A0A7Z9BVC2_9CYAN|nr:hypothetical protein PL8927_780083 [Planktothrix serta PCC 8927]
MSIGVRNRVSQLIFLLVAKVNAETRFLGITDFCKDLWHRLNVGAGSVGLRLIRKDLVEPAPTNPLKRVNKIKSLVIFR